MSAAGKFFLEKKISDINSIMYICRKNNKSIIYFSNGEKIETFIPVRGMLDELPSSIFVTINKGLAINMHYVTDVNKNVYTMSDGSVFEGRVRNIGAHNKNATIIAQSTRSKSYSNTPIDAFKVFDNFPAPFCVVEVQFDKGNNGTDMIFRYCNVAINNFTRISNDVLIGHSLKELFKDYDSNWVTAFGEIALNGDSRVIYDSTRHISLYCYQPFPGMVGCMTIPEDITSNN